jgi:hypothetical protein
VSNQDFLSCVHNVSFYRGIGYYSQAVQHVVKLCNTEIGTRHPLIDYSIHPSGPTCSYQHDQIGRARSIFNKRAAIHSVLIISPRILIDMRVYLQPVVILLSLSRWATALPAWSSLAGLSVQEIDAFARTVTVAGAHPPPGPDPNTSSHLVNDAAHPYHAPGPNDIRGPCPGLNTLASHGVSSLD